MTEINKTSRHVSRLIATASVYSSIIQENADLRNLVISSIEAYNNRDFFYFSEIENLDFLKPDLKFLDALIDLYLEKKSEYLEIIDSCLIEKYKLDKIDKALQAIIMLACVELMYFGDVPTSVIIDEYVNLTRAFYENPEVGFINKSLDNMAKIIRNQGLV